MKSKNIEFEKKLKHREVERLRHHKLQKLIQQLNEVIPSEKKVRETQCAILKRACDYIEFMINEYNRVAAIIEVEGFSSQSTTASSQGKLIIDESHEVEQITVDLDPPDDFDDGESHYPAISSAFLSPESYYDFSPEPEKFNPQSWNSFNMDDGVEPQHLYAPTQPLLSPPPLLPIFNRPVENLVDIKPKQVFSHCRSCSCFSHDGYVEKKTYYPRDRLLTDTMDYPINSNIFNNYDDLEFSS